MLYYRRKNSLRMLGFDYSSPGYYFVTICTFLMIEWFGDYVEGRVLLNNVGKIVVDEIVKTSQIRLNVKIDCFVVMPNHIHAIIVINNSSVSHRDNVGVSRRETPTLSRWDTIDTEKSTRVFLKPNSLGSIIGQIKSICTKRIRGIGYEGFRWQRNFYDRIIRNEKQLRDTRLYIQNNPQNWLKDTKNPINIKLSSLRRPLSRI